MIEVSDLSIRRQSGLVLDGFSAKFPAASITAIIGPNGSGKSSLLESIAGTLPISSGRITFDGCDVVDISLAELAKIRAVVIQAPQFFLGFTVGDLLQLGYSGSQQNLLDTAQELGIAELLTRSVLDLSGGERQRVALAHAIARDCQYLLLDEPFSAQDIESRKRIIAILKRLAQAGKTIIFVAHMKASELNFCDQILKTQSK